jgi:hypothetical protein
VVFERNVTLRRTHSAHSRAMARWVSLLRSRISNSEPYRLDSGWAPLGMKNSRRALRSLSVAFVGTNDGAVKMNSSSPTCSNSLRRASNAKIEKVDAAMRTFAPGLISSLEVVPQDLVDVVDEFHVLSPLVDAAAPPRRTHSSTSSAWNFQSRPIL